MQFKFSNLQQTGNSRHTLQLMLLMPWCSRSRTPATTPLVQYLQHQSNFKLLKKKLPKISSHLPTQAWWKLYMCHWIGSSLVKVMLSNQHQIFSWTNADILTMRNKLQCNSNQNPSISTEKMHPKCYLQNVNHFPGANELWVNKISKNNLQLYHPFSDLPCHKSAPGPCLNIKTVLSTYGDFHVKDKTAVTTSYL